MFEGWKFKYGYYFELLPIVQWTINCTYSISNATGDKIENFKLAPLHLQVIVWGSL